MGFWPVVSVGSERYSLDPELGIRYFRLLISSSQ